MYKITLFLLLTLSLHAKIYDGVAVVVKEKAITLFEIKREMQTSRMSAKEATDILIRQKLEEGEIQKRQISINSEDVYADIKKMAKRNQMSVSEFYDAIRETNGLSSSDLKEKIKQKLLSQKLYGAIAYSSVSQPSEAEVQEYYDVHKKKFEHPSAFNVLVYECAHKEKLQQKIDNPMFYSSDISTKEAVLEYKKIAPPLAKLLQNTPLNSCSKMVPNGRGSYVSFYLKSIENNEKTSIKSVKNQIINEIMEQQREQVLGDYFARLRHTADINIIRMPE